MKYLILILIIIKTCSTYAEPKKYYWYAKALENSCVAGLDMSGISIPTQDQGAYINVIIPHAHFEDSTTKRLKEGEPRILIYVRPFLWLDDQYKRIPATKVSMSSRNSEYQMELESDDQLQSFFILGNKANFIWESIVKKQPVELKITPLKGKSISLIVHGEYIDRVSRMLKACAG